MPVIIDQQWCERIPSPESIDNRLIENIKSHIVVRRAADTRKA